MAWSANHLEVPPPPPRNLIVAAAADDTAQGRHASTFSRPEFFSKISRRTDFVGFFERFPSDPVGAFSLFCSQPYGYFQCLVACKDYRIKVFIKNCDLPHHNLQLMVSNNLQSTKYGGLKRLSFEGQQDSSGWFHLLLQRQHNSHPPTTYHTRWLPHKIITNSKYGNILINGNELLKSLLLVNKWFKSILYVIIQIIGRCWIIQYQFISSGTISQKFRDNSPERLHWNLAEIQCLRNRKHELTSRIKFQ